MTARPWAIAYGALAALGAVVPLGIVLPWVAAHGLAPRPILAALFANRVSGFFASDVLISALALLLFVAAEARRERALELWAPVAATLLVGVSCGLPLFLMLRASRRA